MKQHITLAQYEELSDDAKLKLIKWVSSWTKVTDPLTTVYQDMNTGRMIEFLSEKGMISLEMGEDEEGYTWQIYDHLDTIFTKDHTHITGAEYIEKKELVDALWEAVKEVLTAEAIQE